jgi:DNA adenine methylase
MTVEAFRTRPSRLKRPSISPLRYPGGKASLYTRLRALLRYNGLTSGTYIEPYAGGAGAALGLLVTGQVARIVINDLDPAIYAFWRCLIDSPKDFSQMIRDAQLSVDEWEKQHDAYLHAPRDDYARLGFATFYLNRTNRSGVLNGGPIGGMDQTGNYKIDARFNKDTLLERVRLIGMYSRRIAVHNADGIAIIQEYARNVDAFIYADPPYFEKAGSLYLNSFTTEDHEALAACLNGLGDTRWLLTYDNVPEVARLYAKRRSEEFSLNYSAHRVIKAKEIMVYSDSLVIDEERLL